MKPASGSTDIIPFEAARTLPAVFRERVRRSPSACAYRRVDRLGRCCETTTWAEVERLAARWQVALQREGLKAGERVAVMLRNSLEWVLFDLAALGLGLVTVPLFFNDRPENFAFVIEETDARLLLIQGAHHWEQVRAAHGRLNGLARIVAVAAPQEDDDARLMTLDRWLPDAAADYEAGDREPDRLASIVYTWRTAGRPRGVMLSHANILANLHACLSRVPVHVDDLFLSFLPLSHTLERTVGYYLPMVAGACVAHVRSLEKLPEDLTEVSPTVIVGVPLLFEKVHRRITDRLAKTCLWRRWLFGLTLNVGRRRLCYGQGRCPWSFLLLLWPLLDRFVAKRVLAALGGRIRLAISGGAPLIPEVAETFGALGLTILQGYGLTETSPVVSVNTMADNRPETAGRPLPGIDIKLAENRELLVRGPSIMRGYWRNETATRAAIDSEGWLHTGDQASVDGAGHITITGRLADIIVLANGEKVPPADIEQAIAADPLFEQVMVVGEGRPFLAALVALKEAEWESLARALGTDPRGKEVPAARQVEQALLARIAERMNGFPGHARIRRVHATRSSWRVNDGLPGATLEIRRDRLLARFAAEIDRLYEGP